MGHTQPQREGEGDSDSQIGSVWGGCCDSTRRPGGSNHQHFLPLQSEGREAATKVGRAIWLAFRGQYLSRRRSLPRCVLT